MRTPNIISAKVCMATALAAVSMFAAPVVAGPLAEAADLLHCGGLVTRELGLGETHRYVPLLPGSEISVGVVDVTDVSGEIGDFRIVERGRNGNTIREVCGRTLIVDAGSTVEVSDCDGADAGAYAVTLTSIPNFGPCRPGLCDCGVLLQCGAPAAAALTDAGEVDSFVFVVGEGVGLTVSVTDPDDTERRFRIRALGPIDEEEPCGNSLELSVDDPDPTVVLVSACDGVSTGTYQIRWDRVASCRPVPSNEVLYVLNAGSASVDVIRTATHQLEATVRLPGGLEPSGPSVLQKSPNSAFAYTGSTFSGFIPAIDTSAGRVAAAAVFPDLETSFVIGPNGRSLYAPSTTLGGIAVIDTATMAIASTISVPEVHAGAGIAISADGQTLYVGAGEPCSACQGRIEIVSLASGEVVGTIADESIGPFHEIRLHPGGSLAYVFPDMNGTSILVVDLAARAVVSAIPVIVTDLEFTADGARAYAPVKRPSGGPGVNGVAIIDAATHAVVDTIPFGFGEFRSPHGIEISPASGLVYVTDIDAEIDAGDDDPPPGVAVVDPQSREIIPLFLSGSNPAEVLILTPPPGLCAGDEVRESKVTVGELVTSVNFALDGCPGTE